MTRVVVGYTATGPGRDAVAVAARLAATTGSALDLATVLPASGRSVITPPDAGYDRYLVTQADQWLAAAAATVPAGIEVAVHVRPAESFAEGLIQLADELAAAAIVVGAAGGAGRGRHRLGATTTELLHSSDVPILLVPRGARKTEAPGVSRLTVAVGSRPGADALLQETADLAAATGAPVRLLSLLTVDLPPRADTAAIRIAGSENADDVLAAARAELPAHLDPEVVVARGDSIEEAVTGVDWQPGEVLLVGSSRLAQPRRLFLGSTAAKMLRQLPVPMLVVPRTRAPGGARS